MQSEGLSMISTYLHHIILIFLISHGTPYFILSPSNLTTCQDSPAMFQCQISDNVPISWLINGMDPIFLTLNSPSTDVQAHLSTLLIPSSRNFSGVRIKCSYKLMPLGNAEYSSEAILTAIGPFTTPSLTSLPVNLTTSNISWNLPSEDQSPLATFIYSTLLIRNRNGTVVYNMTTQSQSLIFSIPDPCNTYDVTVSAVYQNPSTTCIINSSVPLTGAAPSAMLKMLYSYLLPPTDIYQMDNSSLNISFAFQPEVCNYFIVASTGNQVFSFSHLKPLVSNGVSTINIQLATNNIFNLTIIATNRYGNSTTYSTISSFDVVNVTIEVSPTTGLCEVMCAYNSGSNAQGCLVFLKHEATGELYCISLYFNNTVMTVMKETLECNSGLLKSGMYYVNASDIEKNGSISETLAVTNVMLTCNPLHPASDETNIAGAATAAAAAAVVTVLILVVVVVVVVVSVSKKFRTLTSDEDYNKTSVEPLSLASILDNKGQSAIESCSVETPPVELPPLTSVVDNKGRPAIESCSVEIQLMKASNSGDHQKLEVLQASGAQVNQLQNECTQLMEASKSGNIQQLTALLEKGAKVDQQDKEGWTALMRASQARHKECVQVLLDKGADVNMQGKEGWTALMMASQAGHMECVQVLLDKGADVNMQSKSGDTALHLAVRAKVVGEKDQIRCVRTLLFHPGIDVNLKNFEGRTAMRDAGYGSLSVFNQVLKTCNDFPADSFGKVVLCGNSGAGKSTLTQAIINISKPTATRFANRVFGREGVVGHLTAGITPHQIESPYSNMIIYDLAGHHQFVFSHSACLEAISLNSPAIFLLLQDLTKDSETMAMEVRYWSTMIDNVCHKCPQKSSVIVVGTHADLLTSKELTQKKQSDLDAVFKMAASHQTLVAVITVNLKNIYSATMDQFWALLDSKIKEVLSMSPPISLMCQMMLSFLKERLPLDMHAILLSDLLIHLDTDQDNFINPDITAVVPLLKALSEKGFIVFIPSEDPHSSWVVRDKESILKNINGALFADPVLKKSTGLASTTGIISTVVLKKAFPDYNCDMITQFMVHFEIGQAVDLSKIKTNMAPEGSTSSDLGPLLFIPALVSIDRPRSATVPNNSFCWSEIVKYTDQFFTPRFHHVLLHRLPLEFALPEAQTTSLNFRPTLNRLCDVWSRGIKWLSETGVTTVVEMSESFQAISLTMFSHNKASPKYLELAHSVREVIKKARQEFCPYLEVLEVVSCPPECSSDHSIDTRVELSRLRKAILEKKTHVSDVSGTRSVAIDEWKKMEPHLSSLVEACTLTSQVLPPVEEPSARQPLSEMIDQVVKDFQDETPTLLKLLSFSECEVNIAEQIGVNYLMFGMILLQDDNGAIVKALEEEHHRNAEKINTAIFQKWLDGKGIGPVTWSTLVTALQKITVWK